MISKNNHQIPSTNHQIISKISMTKIQNEAMKYGFVIGSLEFIWDLEFGNWNLIAWM
jgi:hypothetical protein